MTPQERSYFIQLYAGTNAVIRDLCTEGSYQKGMHFTPKTKMRASFSRKYSLAQLSEPVFYIAHARHQSAHSAFALAPLSDGQKFELFLRLLRWILSVTVIKHTPDNVQHTREGKFNPLVNMSDTHKHTLSNCTGFSKISKRGDLIKLIAAKLNKYDLRIALFDHSENPKCKNLLQLKNWLLINTYHCYFINRLNSSKEISRWK